MAMPDAARRLRSRLAGRAVGSSSAARRLTYLLRSASRRRTDPLTEWGFERGTPVDRWYIERFLQSNEALVRGHVLEVKQDLYASRLGAASVEVVDIDAENPEATIVADLCVPGSLPKATFDAAIITQTLQLVADPVVALENLRDSLRPGGTLLLTVPAMSRLAGSSDRWRWTPTGLSDLVAQVPGSWSVAASGNCLAARAFLLGAGAGDLAPGALAVQDTDFPVVVTAVLRTE
ncbi:MAG TPA: methyltransferase domain-containing protein [Actinomycetales bacterium]|jgi:SAM-dependent methyltransferase